MMQLKMLAPKSQSLLNWYMHLAIQLKALSMQIGDMGEEYASASIYASDASEKIRSTFRKSNNERRAVKQKLARQPLMSAFIKNKLYIT